MADWWSLTDFACRAPDPSRIMARQDDGREQSHADFLIRLGQWQAAFSGQAHTQWAIYLKDPLDFAAAVLAAWHAGKTVALPGDDLPGTVQALLDSDCALAGDLPAALQAPAGIPGETAHRRPIDPRAAKLKVYTSGSQGLPEAIDKRLDQLLSEIEALESSFGQMLAGAGEPTVWATVSHQHIYGLLFLVLWPMAAGRPFSQRRLLYPGDLAASLGSAPSVLIATPAHLKRLGEHVDWQAARQELRAVFSSAGPLPFEVSQAAAQALGRSPIEVFGSSETGGIAWRQSASAQEPWRPFMDVQWRLDEGCLAVSSPRLPDDRWWMTSDRAEAAGVGSFRLLGRVDRIVKIEGKRISLTAIEQHLLATPWVQEAKALVVDTSIGGRVAVAAVLTESGREQHNRGRRVLVGLLRQALAEFLEAVALPRRWCFVDALPVNTQGKTPESLVAALFAPQPATVDAAPPSSGLPTVQWEKREEAEAVASLDIHAGLPVFQGHFDAAPILPGVAQLDWALALGRECFAIPDWFVRLEALKFVRPVQPGTALKVALQFKPRLADAGLCSLTFRFYSRDETTAGQHEHASGRAVWSYDPGAAHA
jgi:hypothetical protein